MKAAPEDFQGNLCNISGASEFFALTVGSWTAFSCTCASAEMCDMEISASAMRKWDHVVLCMFKRGSSIIENLFQVSICRKNPAAARVRVTSLSHQSQIAATFRPDQACFWLSYSSCFVGQMWPGRHGGVRDKVESVPDVDHIWDKHSLIVPQTNPSEVDTSNKISGVFFPLELTNLIFSIFQLIKQIFNHQGSVSETSRFSGFLPWGSQI